MLIGHDFFELICSFKTVKFVALCHSERSITIRMPTSSKNTNKLIHIGDNTHHHDQEMTPLSLRPIKTMVVNVVMKPMPEEEDSLAMVQAPRFQAAASRSF
jgi:hypothetical protein